MTVLSGKPKHSLYGNLPATAPVILQRSTIIHLQELSMEMSNKDKQEIITYDNIIVDMIRVYRAKKRLGDLWPSESYY